MSAKTKLLIITIYVIAVLLGCDTTEPKPKNELITLTSIDVSVTEAYIHVKVESPDADREVLLKRDGKEVLSFNAGIEDTIVVDTNLTKSTSYSYSANLAEQNEIVGESNKITLTTLEPTSHEFIWETYTFGDYQSFLYDVSVIEEPGGTYQIWAVGEVYLKDGEGEYDSQPYGLVRWDGHEWKVERTNYRDYNQPNPSPSVTNTIWSFGLDNTFLCSYANLAHWNGSDLTEVAYFLEELPFTGQVGCMWGKDENNIYLGSGRDGSLYYYYGEGWSKLDAGSINGGITDIFGYQSPIDNKWKIFATVTFVAKPSDHKILEINENNSVSEFPWLEEERISSVWTRKGLPIYSAGNGVHIWKGEEWKKIPGLPSKFAGHVSGTTLNNIFVVGDFNMALHFNGESWQILEDNKYGWYQTVKMNDNIVVMVGTRDGKAIIKIGKR